MIFRTPCKVVADGRWSGPSRSIAPPHPHRHRGQVRSRILPGPHCSPGIRIRLAASSLHIQQRLFPKSRYVASILLNTPRDLNFETAYCRTVKKRTIGQALSPIFGSVAMSKHEMASLNTQEEKLRALADATDFRLPYYGVRVTFPLVAAAGTLQLK